MMPIPAFNWWSLAIRGAFGIIFGLFAFFMPVVTLFAVTLLFGIYAFIDGILSLTTAFRFAGRGDHWWPMIVEGIVGLAAAAVTFIWPGLTLLALIYVIAAWAIITGAFEFAAAIRLRRQISNEWLLGVAGVLSVLFGILLFAAPGPGAVVLVWWMGAYVFVFGVLMLGLAFRLRHVSAGSPRIHLGRRAA